MAIFDFRYVSQRTVQTGTGITPEQAPINNPPSNIGGFINDEVHTRQYTDVSDTYHVTQIKDLLIPAFKAQDRGIKEFFSNMLVPGKDVVREVGVRIAGGDKSFLQWRQNIRQGRIILPAVSIDRKGANWNPQKFSPAYIPASKAFTSVEGTHVKVSYRPRPYIIDYTLSIWAEHKEDAEVVLFQILSKFAPLAQLSIDTNRIIHDMILKLEGYSNASDIEAGPDEPQKFRYDVNLTCEGYIEVPEIISPVILGRVSALYTSEGEFLDTLDTNKTINLNTPVEE